MKKGLLGSTALVAATAFTVGAAQAQEGPTVSFGGFGNFQVYIVDQDAPPVASFTTPVTVQDGGIYFGVDDAELTVNVKGTSASGLDYGLKVEMEMGTTGGANADEARIQLGGSWGTLQLGDEDGAEDILNVGGENLMGATGGFDGDQDDWYNNIGAATSFPVIAGDTSDHTKITYYSPDLSGIKLGLSWTPSSDQDGDEFKTDGVYENHIGVGAKYSGAFGGVNLQASAVYSTASVSGPYDALSQQAGGPPPLEDIGAFSVGAIAGFGPFSVGANWTDNGESGQLLNSGTESSYWDVGASWANGPLAVAVGYLDSVTEFTGGGEDTYTHLAVTVDYEMAEGLGVYAEVSSISSETAGGTTNDGTGIIVGTQVSF